ncbi:MAG TPA: NTP transferase domain-containing protein [Gemmatimonadales bacterium]|nr:NTP transferase domain-containing protein [Gemmatimonadales bacterium]
MKSVAIIQARLGSRRFPGKVLQDLGGRPVLAHVVERCQAIPGISQVALTIPPLPEDDPLADWADDHGIACHRGQFPLAGTEANDCLAAYQAAAYALNADVVVRVTADCPLIDSALAGEILALVGVMDAGGPAVFASNCRPMRTFPDGLDVEAFTAALLEDAHYHEPASSPAREHVTGAIARLLGPHELARHNVRWSEDLSAVRWTVDTRADLERLRQIVAHLPAGAFTLADTRKAAEAAGLWP